MFILKLILKRVASFTPRSLYTRGRAPGTHWIPLNMRLGGLQSRSGRGGE